MASSAAALPSVQVDEVDDDHSVTSVSSVDDDEADVFLLAPIDPLTAGRRSPRSGSQRRRRSPMRRSRSFQNLHTPSAAGSIGPPKVPPKGPVTHAEAVIRALRKKVLDKEAEAGMAADIGQMLLKEIDELKNRLERYETPDLAKLESTAVARLLELRRDYDMYMAATAAAAGAGNAHNNGNNGGSTPRTPGQRRKPGDQLGDRTAIGSPRLPPEEDSFIPPAVASAAAAVANQENLIHNQL
ncbi:hypothetical protein SYNPS1DRAFT_20748, partial [Syncephalis pseudoplumigaleata]